LFDVVTIVLENFRSFKGRHIFGFPTAPGLYNLTGVNLVTPRLGANGAGKSTLLDALFWCLFGRTPRGLKAGKVVSRGERGCWVKVQLAGGMCIRRAQSPNSLVLNKEPVTQETLERQLRLGPEAFLHSILFPQFGTCFFDLAPAAKLALFSQIMELEFWLEKSQEADVKAKALSEMRYHHEHIIVRHTGRLEAITADIKALKPKNEQFEKQQFAEVKLLEDEGRQLAKTNTKLDTELDAARVALTNADKRLAKARKQVGEICPTCGQPVQDKRLERDLKTLMQNQNDFTHRVQRIEYERKNLWMQAEEVDRRITKEKEQGNPYATMIKEKVQERLDLKAKIQAETKAMDEVTAKHAAVSYWATTGFKLIRLREIDTALCQLELEVNNNLAALGLTDYRVEFDVERENKAGGVTRGFVVLIYVPGEGAVTWEEFSGGEVQRLRLAGDLGLANLILQRAGLSGQIEIYDEPSEHMSEEGLLDLAETLDSRAMTTGKRILMVDHRLIDYNFAGRITAVKDKNGSRLEVG
jgi:DNA repair exonuclease SbcCD ATPase subunit